MSFGWAGKMLLVDLSNKKFFVKPFQEYKELALSFLGGRGINSAIQYAMIPTAVDPFGPENLLIVGVGPLVATGCPAASRWNVSGKSPITYTLGDSNAGGFFGAELKKAGYDCIIIRGIAEKPGYLLIRDNNVEIRDAQPFWGLDTFSTQNQIACDLGDQDVKIACIGPAGENLVRFASIVHGKKRSASRTGMGAIMGSKNLKALVVRGTGKVEVADPDRFYRRVRDATRKLMETPLVDIFARYGTTMLVRFAAEGGWLTTRNAKTGYFEGAEKLFEDVFEKNYKIGKYACSNCPIACGNVYKLEDASLGTVEWEGPEYNFIMEFGPNLGVDHFPAILKANEVLSKLGLDADGTGCNIAFAMELFERGIISEAEIGFKLKWGDYEAALKLVEMIATRKGFGDILAEGMYLAARKIGKGAEESARVVKRMEVNNELRGRKGYALAYAVSTRGPDHLRGAPNIEYFSKIYPPEIGEKMFGTSEVLKPRTYEGKAKAVVWTEHICALSDALGMCKFATAWNALDFLGVEDMAELLSPCIGREVTADHLMLIGERIVNLERLINVRDGYTRKDDTLPPRQLKEPCPSGPAKGEVVNLEPMLDEYYTIRGWDVQTGIPTKQKIQSLGLSELTIKL